MRVSRGLPDYLDPGLRAVICGTAAGAVSAKRGRYYAGPGNEFWSLLYASGLTEARLDPSRDSEILKYGLGLTDIAKRVGAGSDWNLDADDFDVDGFVDKIELFRPGWVAFHGKTAAKVVGRSLGEGRDVSLGEQDWEVGGRPVFVLPSASASNRDPSRLEGKPSRQAWFQEFARLLERNSSSQGT